MVQMFAPQALENIPISSPSGNFLLFLPPTKGALTFSLTYLRGNNIVINHFSGFTTHESDLQISFPMVLPSSLLDFLRLGSLRVRVVVNFLNYNPPRLTGGRVRPEILTISLQKLLYFP